MLSFLGVKYSEIYKILGILVWDQICFSDALGHWNSIYLSVFMFIIIASATSQLFLTTVFLGRVREFSTAILKFIHEVSSGELRHDAYKSLWHWIEKGKLIEATHLLSAGVSGFSSNKYKLGMCTVDMTKGYVMKFQTWWRVLCSTSVSLSRDVSVVINSPVFSVVFLCWWGFWQPSW